MTGADHKSLFFCDLFQVFFYEPVLHPVLAYLSGFSVCDQFVGIKCHIKIQVIVDHDLNGLSGQAFPFVFVHGFSVDSSVGTETVAVDPAVFHKFLVKFRNDLPVVFGGNITQSVFEGKLYVCLTQCNLPLRCPAYCRVEGTGGGERPLPCI